MVQHINLNLLWLEFYHHLAVLQISKADADVIPTWSQDSNIGQKVLVTAGAL